MTRNITCGNEPTKLSYTAVDELKKEITKLLTKYNILRNKNDAGQIVCDINNSLVTGIRLDKWRII